MSIPSNRMTQTVADKGFSYESHFRNGAEGIIARHDAPKLCFPDSMPLESVRDTIELWNALLGGICPGKGYYAFSQAEEMAHPGYHVLVLFSDEDFCSKFLGVVATETLPPSFGGMMQRQFRG
ncbi:hypothetical protein [Pseudomonas sp. NPDC089569]|uniref:hypothetical protein n=1 Tax=Pseudomonas sp. NPDC089569 TaxID=3390722 RepID=UPI003D085E12